MENNKSIKNKSNIFVVKNRYYISLNNAAKKTQGSGGDTSEGWGTARKYWEYYVR